MATEVSGGAPELTEHEQAMVDLVDSKEAASAGSADPENASEYVEPEVTPDEGAEGEIDYKAKYEELLSKGKPEDTPEKSGLDISEEASEDITPDKAEEVSTLTPDQMNKYSAEFNANGGLSETSYSELTKLGLSKAVVDSYIQGQAAIQEAQHTKAYTAVGGEEVYSDMIAWAKQTWSPEQISVFNSQVQSGNSDRIMFGVESLAAQYKAANGSPMPRRALSGSTQGTSGGGTKGYADKGEMYKAMRNPMYGKDASYTQAVAKKIEQSTF